MTTNAEDQANFRQRKKAEGKFYFQQWVDASRLDLIKRLVKWSSECSLEELAAEVKRLQGEGR